MHGWGDITRQIRSNTTQKTLLLCLSFLNTSKSNSLRLLFAIRAVLTHNKYSLLWGAPPSPLFPGFFSPVFLCLPSDAYASIFYIPIRSGLTYKRIFAEVTQVKGFLPFPYPIPIESGLSRCMRLSSVKVPRPASPYITHETPVLLGGTAVAVSRGNGWVIYWLTVYVVDWCVCLDHS